MTTKNKAKNRQAIRSAASATGSTCPIKIVEGANAPSYEGEGFYHTTRGGERVRHPGAYAKKGWSNLIYVASTLRIEVGTKWLAERGITSEMVTL